MDEQFPKSALDKFRQWHFWWLVVIVAMFMGFFLSVVKVGLSQSNGESQNNIDFPQIKGQVSGTKTIFEITDSDYLNITLQSSIPIEAAIQSAPKVVSVVIQPNVVSPLQLTFSGFAPNKTYYRYDNSFKNETIFNTDGTGNFSFIQDLFQGHHIWIQESKGTIFIPADCNTVGTFNPATTTCTLNQDLSTNIEITDNGLTLDCNNHKLSDGFRWTSFAILLNNRQNVTVKNCVIKNATNAVNTSFSNNNTFINNNVSGNEIGFRILSSDNNAISNNRTSADTQGIALGSFSDGNNVTNNDISDLLFGVTIGDHTNSNKIEANTITGHSSTGIHITALSSSNQVLNNDISNSPFGIFILQSNGTSVIDNTIQNNQNGIAVGVLSFGTKVFHNNFINNTTQAQVFTASSFDNGLPDGGNFWNNYDTPAEGCHNLNNDNFCDAPLVFTGGQDNFPWTKQDGWKGPPVTTLKVAVILAEFSDSSHLSTAVTERPCKLIPQKTYPNGHDKTFYKDLLFCVENYHRENSFETVDLSFTIFDNDGDWFDIGKNKLEFQSGNEINFVKDVITVSTANGVDLSPFDIVAAVHEGSSFQKTRSPADLETLTWTPKGQPSILGLPPFKFVIAEDNLVGPWAHELGHLLGELVLPNPADHTVVYDFYKMGLDSLRGVEEGRWDLMAFGPLNNGGNNPPHMSSFTKEFLRLLDYNIHPRLNFGNHVITNATDFGDSVFRYNLENNTDPDTKDFYILEARNRTLNTWDESIPREKALVLYRVETFGFKKYGYEDEVGDLPIHRKWNINIPFFNGVLAPIGDIHLDLGELLRFTAVSDGFVSGNYNITAKIESILPEFFDRLLHGAVLEPNRQLLQASSFFFPPELNTQPSFGTYDNILLHKEDCCGFVLGFGAYIVVSLMIIANISWLFRHKIPILRNTGGDIKEFFMPTVLKLNLFVLISFFTNKSFGLLYPLSWAGIVHQYFSRVLGYSYPVKIFVFNIIVNILLWYMLVCFVAFVFKYRFEGRKIIRIIAALVTFGAIIAAVSLALRYADPASTLILRSTDNPQILSDPIPEFANLPDLDLHAITPDNRHVGVNYETGEYEIQIPNTITVGDMSNGTEWIFIPQNEKAVFFVSSSDSRTFLNQNPDIASQITDESDSYNIYARFIDPDTDIFTSNVVTNQSIKPGDNIIHKIFGTTDISISEGFIKTEVRIKPETLNLVDRGLFTAFIQFPEGFSTTIKDINPATLILSGASAKKMTLNKGTNTLIAKFNTRDLVSVSPGNLVTLTIAGQLLNGTTFEGSDTIRVAKKGNILSVFTVFTNVFYVLITMVTNLFATISSIYR